MNFKPEFEPVDLFAGIQYVNQYGIEENHITACTLMVDDQPFARFVHSVLPSMILIHGVVLGHFLTYVYSGTKTRVDSGINFNQENCYV